MRRRIIKPEFWSSIKVSTLSRDARLLFIAVWNIADDYGVILDNDRRLFGEAFPFDEDISVVDVRRWKNELVEGGFLHPIVYEGKAFLWVDCWTNHQRIDKPSPKYWTTRNPEQLLEDNPLEVNEIKDSTLIEKSSRKVLEKFSEELELEVEVEVELEENTVCSRKTSFSHKKQNLEDRLADFKSKILEFRGIYSDQMLEGFFNYWSQETANKKELLFERERRKKAFDIQRRLVTWRSNDRGSATKSRIDSKLSKNLARRNEMKES